MRSLGTCAAAFAALLSCFFVTPSASEPELVDQIGIFADPAGTVTTMDFPGQGQTTFYVVAFNLEGDPNGYEFGIDMSADFIISNTVWWSPEGVTPTVFGDARNAQVGSGGCLDGTGAIVLAEITIGTFVAVGDDTQLRIRPSSPSSFDPPSPGYNTCDNRMIRLDPATCETAFYPSGALIMNATHPAPPVCGRGPSVDYPDTVTFGSVALGDSTEQTFHLIHRGDTVEDFSGEITEQCGEFSIVSGEGAFTLSPGDSLAVTVQYRPDGVGPSTCQIEVDPSVPAIGCIGEGVVPSVSPQLIDFGTVYVGDIVFRDFTIVNEATSGHPIEGVATESCPSFAIVQGAAYSIEPGQSHQVTVAFFPADEGPYDCSIAVGETGVSASCTASALLPPECFVSVDSLQIPQTVVGNPSEGSFYITNLAGSNLLGNLTLDCPEFAIVEGGGSFSIAAGDTLDVRVRYTPEQAGTASCVIPSSGFCPEIVVSSAAEESPAFVDRGVALGDGYTRAVTWGDVDRDGDQDLYLTRRQLPNILFMNEEGTLVENTPPVLADPRDGFSSLWIDQNNDGHLGMLVSNLGEPNAQILNDAKLGMIANPSGNALIDALNSRVIAPVDFNLDGLVDLYVAQHGGQPNLLLRATAGGAVYEQHPASVLEVTDSSRSASWADMDDDGHADLYVVNSSSPNQIFRNDAGTFIPMDVPALAVTGNNTDACWGDYDNDGDLDVYVTSLEDPNFLIRNDGNWQFTDVTTGSLGDPGRSGSPSWIDVDLDGDLDLHFVNGPGPDALFLNVAGTFFDASIGDIADPANHAGSAWSDLDGDGDPDVALANWDAGMPSKVVRNDNDNGNHWVGFDLYGTTSNRFGLGARIRLVADGITQTRWVGTGNSGKAPTGYRVSFGLGQATVIDSLEIRWPSGIVDQGLGLEVDRNYESTEGGSVTAVDDGRPPAASTRTQLFQNHPNPFNPRTSISFELGSPSQVRIDIFDLAGRRVRRLLDQSMGTGSHHVLWRGLDDDGNPVSSGVYLIRFRAGSYERTIRATLVR